MENTPLVQKTPTAFIPKNKKTPARKRKYYNIFFGFSVTVLFCVLGVWGALFIYNRTLVAEKSQIESELKTVTEDIVSEELVQDFQELELRLTMAEKLLNGHVNAAPLISKLEDLTLSNNIQFDGLNFTATEAEFYSISMSGTARNFESLGHQERLFNEEPAFTDVVFNQFSIDEETGFVKFGLAMNVSRELISYKNQKGVGQEDEESANSENES